MALLDLETACHLATGTLLCSLARYCLIGDVLLKIVAVSPDVSWAALIDLDTARHLATGTLLCSLARYCLIDVSWAALIDLDTACHLATGILLCHLARYRLISDVLCGYLNRCNVHY
ncbi:hypothetical protein J6590_049989 [Homalodisca vitripennis]|nr:hypothetical protein J6590_049989 [Homalodisca vitripennis]